ncbi:hypothetical protein Q757_07195 [Oenococcus alcoholitolerans]|uniref:Uncharacterized protein n=1 Tax=Oenococcus alcoholitolerans TaxID=931074 RepID=A0ABR4XPZ3_9LACO|nr:hypothetical protein Q757_07195 [Oenococcus alcoholitolerans]
MPNNDSKLKILLQQINHLDDYYLDNISEYGLRLKSVDVDPSERKWDFCFKLKNFPASDFLTHFYLDIHHTFLDENIDAGINLDVEQKSSVKQLEDYWQLVLNISNLDNPYTREAARSLDFF